MVWQNRIVGAGTEDPEKLIPHPKNWRKHPKGQAQALEGAIEEIGWIQDIIINQRTGRMIDGHLRAELAIKNKEKVVPVKYVDLSEEEEEKALLTLDPISMMAEADKDRLSALLQNITSDNEKVNQLLEDIGREYKVSTKKAEEDNYEPPAEIETDIVRGDIFQLGRHRVMCGDSTCREDVERLMDGEKADCTVTDPPYGIGIDYKDYEDNENNIKFLIDTVIQNLPLPAALTPGVPSMWLYPKPTWIGAWVHPATAGSCPWGFIGSNPILFYGDDPYLKIGQGRRPDSIVLAVGRDDISGHPTPKPLKIWCWLVERLTPKKREIVFDPFLGSGTTLIACEQLDRICYGMEISPQYCEVICQRWEKFTGNKREKVNGVNT